MNLVVNIPANFELALRQKAAAAGKEVEAFVQELVIEDVIEEPVPTQRKTSNEDFVAKLRDMIERHGISNGNFDDSRESIYAGRGE